MASPFLSLHLPSPSPPTATSSPFFPNRLVRSGRCSPPSSSTSCASSSTAASPPPSPSSPPHATRTSSVPGSSSPEPPTSSSFRSPPRTPGRARTSSRPQRISSTSSLRWQRSGRHSWTRLHRHRLVTLGIGGFASYI
ncbi:hypothetical protein VPH35_031681 [Triticum aestivum]